MANKNKDKKDDETLDDFEARTKTMTDEERAALDDDANNDNLEEADGSKGD